MTSSFIRTACLLFSPQRYWFVFCRALNITHPETNSYVDPSGSCEGRSDRDATVNAAQFFHFYQRQADHHMAVEALSRLTPAFPGPDPPAQYCAVGVRNRMSFGTGAGGEHTLHFTAPEEPGDHHFGCTFPGHWMTMNGIFRVME